jgi:hypothetical protein
MNNPKSRRGLLAGVAAGIAAAAAVAGNLDKLADFWTAHIASHLAPRADLTIRFDAEPRRVIRLVVTTPVDGAEVGSQKVTGGGEATFRVRASQAYDVTWFGYGFVPSKATGVRVSSGENPWRVAISTPSTSELATLAFQSDLGRPAPGIAPAESQTIFRSGGANDRGPIRAEPAQLIRLFETGSPDPGGDSGLDRSIEQAGRVAQELAPICRLGAQSSRTFLQDRIVQQGAPAVRRVLNECAAETSATAYDEAGRVGWLRDHLLSQVPAGLAPYVSKRMDVIIQGRGTFRGVTYTLATG